MMIIEQLNEHQLQDLQSQITRRLVDIEKEKRDTILRKDSVKHKTKMNQLTTSDRVLCISLHNTKVHAVDYVNVEGYNESTDPDWHRVSFGHKTKPLGCSSSIHKDRAEKGYYLFEMCGSISFFTLFPKTWETDLAEALHDMVTRKKEYQKKEVLTLKNQIGFIFKDKASKNTVDEFVTNN